MIERNNVCGDEARLFLWREGDFCEERGIPRVSGRWAEYTHCNGIPKEVKNDNLQWNGWLSGIRCAFVWFHVDFFRWRHFLMKLNIQDLQKDLPLPALQIPWRPKFPTPFIPRGFPVSLMKFAAFHSRVHLIRKDQGTGWRLGSSKLEKIHHWFCHETSMGHVPLLYYQWIMMNICLGDCMPHEDLTKTPHFDDFPN